MPDASGVDPTLGYPLHPRLVALLESWEDEAPGVGAKVAQRVGRGNWHCEEMDPAGDGAVPPHTVAQAFAMAVATFEAMVRARQGVEDRRLGWWARWLGGGGGPVDLDEHGKIVVARAREQARRAVAALPAGEAGSLWGYGLYLSGQERARAAVASPDLGRPAPGAGRRGPQG